jgi:hypothetical protein
MTDPKYFAQQLTVVRFHPRSGKMRLLPICTYSSDTAYGHPPPCSRAGPPAASPDGRRVAVIAIDRADDGGISGWSLRVLSLEGGTQSHSALGGATPLLPPLEPIVRWTPDTTELLMLRPL